jgi:hypothetical protein
MPSMEALALWMASSGFRRPFSVLTEEMLRCSLAQTAGVTMLHNRLP